MILLKKLGIFLFCISLSNCSSLIGQPTQKRETASKRKTSSKVELFSYSFQEHIKNQWALRDIKILEALKSLENKSPVKPVVVAVIDTGIHTQHICLKNQLWLNTKEIPNNKKDDDNNGFVDDIHGWNFVDNNNNIQDDHGHGTHVSGIIAATGDTGNACRILGIAPQYVKIMVLKYYNEFSESSENIKNTVKSINYARQNGADIINYSGGGPGANEDEKQAILKAADKGIIFVAALGNDGSKIDKKTQFYPASYNLSNIIDVQSHNQNRKRVKSSNYIESTLPGNKPVQTAGESVFSTLPPPSYLRGDLKKFSSQKKWLKAFQKKVAINKDPEFFKRSLSSNRQIPAQSLSQNRGLSNFTRNNHYGPMTGTSQATGIATGVTALIKAKYPNWPINQIIQLAEQFPQLSAYKAVTQRPQKVDFLDNPHADTLVVPHNSDNPELRILNKGDSLFEKLKATGESLSQ